MISGLFETETHSTGFHVIIVETETAQYQELNHHDANTKADVIANKLAAAEGRKRPKVLVELPWMS